MTTSPTYPGVYVEELPPSGIPISGVDTSIALIMGRTIQGPVNLPIQCRSYADYESKFSSDTSLSEMAYQVRQFFRNGGSKCYVMRLVNESQATSDDSAGQMAISSAEYEAAYRVADKEIDLFNLLLLPRDADPTLTTQKLYGPASVFCKRKRAFLLMEAPLDWQDSQDASNGVESLRVGLVNDHAAVFYPDVTINDGESDKHIGPAGTIAGMFARLDSTRGVWRAPAGTEASLLGIVGLQRQLTDQDAGILNPKAINSLRVFPIGVVSWGARTMDGDDSVGSEYKYIPVRRLALFLEESLHRGLKWAVFESNNELLWSQIRLNIETFMQSLFRHGAFQGSRLGEAYFVKCDSETTTQSDQDSGIINIVVGFAPLKPAEFVILSLRLNMVVES